MRGLNSLYIDNNIIGIDPVDKVVLVIGETPLTISDEYEIIRIKHIPYILLPDKPVNRKAKYRPLVCGVSIGHIQITAGTLGTIAYYNDEPYLVSNAHVFHPSPWKKELPKIRDIVQPGPYDKGTIADKVGFIVKHVPVHLENEPSTCPMAKIWSALYNIPARILRRKTRLVPIVTEENRVDCAIAKPVVDYEDTIILDNGEKIDPDNIVGLLFAGSTEDNIFIVSKASNIEKELGVKFTRKTIDKNIKRGDKVQKCGRTTGCTQGTVIARNMTLRVFYGVGFAVFTDVIVVKGESAGGDSGSMVWKI